MCRNSILKKKNILVVDDDPKIVKVLKRVASRNFNEVYTAYSANEAIKILETEIVDLVLTDYEMKEGDGIHLSKNIKDKYLIPFVVMSGKLTKEAMFSFSNNGCFKMMEKPFDLKVFNSLLEELEDFFTKENESQSLIDLGESLGFIIHEIANPLTVLDFNCSRAKRFLDDEGIETVELDKLLNVTHQNVERISKIITNIRDVMSFSSKDQRKTEYALSFISNELENNDYIKMLSSDLNIVYEGFGEEVINVNLDQIVLLFTNIIKNSQEAIGVGNKGYIKINAKESDGKFNFIIIDSGPGVTEEQATKLFKKRVTFKKNGTGFGFELCKKIVENHKGSIAVENNYPMTLNLSLSKAQ
jgi:signal transduction histidine kinase